MVTQILKFFEMLSDPCNLVGFGLAAVGVIIIVAAIIGMALSRRAGALYFIGILIGLGIVLGSVFFGGYLVKACKDATGNKAGFREFYIDIVYEDNTTTRIPTPKTQLIVYFDPQKRIRALRWYAEVDRTKIAEWAEKLGIKKEVEKVKFWMYWNKPLTAGVTLWEKYVSVENYTAVYEMPYSELVAIVQEHAGKELLPSLTGQNFSMDINIGVDIAAPRELEGQLKYDHALKLWVSYYTPDFPVILVDFGVSYATQIAVPQLDENVYLTKFGLAVLVGITLGVLGAYIYLRMPDRRRRRKR